MAVVEAVALPVRDRVPLAVPLGVGDGVRLPEGDPDDVADPERVWDGV